MDARSSFRASAACSSLFRTSRRSVADYHWSKGAHASAAFPRRELFRLRFRCYGLGSFLPGRLVDASAELAGYLAKCCLYVRGQGLRKCALPAFLKADHLSEYRRSGVSANFRAGGSSRGAGGASVTSMFAGLRVGSFGARSLRPVASGSSSPSVTRTMPKPRNPSNW